jgi:hypothetical protein
MVQWKHWHWSFPPPGSLGHLSDMLYHFGLFRKTRSMWT